MTCDLNVGDVVIVRDDDGNEQPHTVKYAPWQLSNGIWLIGLQGIVGGYRLDRVVRLDSAATNRGQE